jgi:hypothetical protein
MQNYTKNFTVYPSLINYFKSTPISDMFRGCLVHIPRNFLIALSGLKIQDKITLTNYYGQTFASQTLAYPFMLIQRRLETITSSGYLRGLGITSASEAPTSFIKMAKLTWREEGFKGFFRGYTCYMVAIMFWMSALPLTSEFMMNAIP